MASDGGAPELEKGCEGDDTAEQATARLRAGLPGATGPQPSSTDGEGPGDAALREDVAPDEEAELRIGGMLVEPELLRFGVERVRRSSARLDPST